MNMTLEINFRPYTQILDMSNKMSKDWTLTQNFTQVSVRI